MPGENPEEQFDPKHNKDLRKAILEARSALMPENYIGRVIHLAMQGFTATARRRIRHRLELQGLLTPSPGRTATTRFASTTSS